MGCRALFVDGVDIDIYFADYVGTCAGAGIVVYPCRRAFVFDWGDILSLAEIKVFTRDLAFVCNCRNGVFFLCGSVWCDIGCVVESVIRLRPSPRRGVPRRVRARMRPFVCSLQTCGIRGGAADKKVSKNQGF